MKKVKAIAHFFDNEAKADRAPGDEWEVTDERAKAINSTVFGQLVEVSDCKEKPKKAAAKAKKKA